MMDLRIKIMISRYVVGIVLFIYGGLTENMIILAWGISFLITSLFIDSLYNLFNSIGEE